MDEIYCIQELADIDKTITAEAIRINEIAKKLRFTDSVEFELNGDTNGIRPTSNKLKGVYFFEIKNSHSLFDAEKWVSSFRIKWEDWEHYWVPGIKDKRVREHKKFDDWIPLYIGKSKNIGSRINEHIHMECTKHTFAMKLKARPNLFGEIFKVSWIPIDVKNYDMIVPSIESALRNIYHPIIGRQ
ncbi:hypothetical protein GFS24_26235 [Chitinophaga sp. SYP-B3965]|uniref:GIY-YIG nuclease family protein n=1 Tax=Chitinophaga sp. SYP-B3965 TaxID=2663120 RepID=UPI0012997B4E|nr:GIY-YIG nuclease family protein [Chitinophaga sp. SYP-B3965]MRG48641.1 hypothetical protein [Chitinophaga sp. SYP-B3965]